MARASAEGALVNAVIQGQAARFWTFVMPEPMSGCWLWIGACTPRRHGRYGIFERYGCVPRKTNSAHIFAYRLLIGEVPEGCELDHVCRNTQCVNPWHLEAVPRRVNLIRGQTLIAANLAKTHCPAGHEYAGANIKLAVHRTKGYRMRLCRECLRQKARGRYWRSKGIEPPVLKPRYRPTSSSISNCVAPSLTA